MTVPSCDESFGSQGRRQPSPGRRHFQKKPAATNGGAHRSSTESHAVKNSPTWHVMKEVAEFKGLSEKSYIPTIYAAMHWG